MITQASPYAKWSVMWKGKNGYVAEKKFDTDFGAALDTYVLLKQSGKKWVTLRCLNAGFPPPDHIINHEVISYEVVKRRGRKYKKKIITHIDQMEEHNANGTWWCPFCVRLRRFVKDPDEPLRLTMMCPVCGVTSDNWHVKRWNPEAKLIEYRRTHVRTRPGRAVRGRSRKR